MQGTGSSTAIVIPWALVAILILLILVIYVRRRRRRSRPGDESGQAKPGDASPGSGDATPVAPETPVGTGVGARGP